MIERTVDFDIDEVYASLKAALSKEGCTTTFDQPQKQFSVKQGSLWGITPKSAKKTVTFNLEANGQKTKVTGSSKLASDWKNITIIGCVFAAVLVGVCLWMAWDLDAFMVTRTPNFWSWIATVNGNVSFQVGQAFAGLARGLAVFLSVVILLEGVVGVFAFLRLDAFAQETLNSLLAKQT